MRNSWHINLEYISNEALDSIYFTRVIFQIASVYKPIIFHILKHHPSAFIFNTQVQDKLLNDKYDI